MRTIFPLPNTIIAQIAAGEVIERPSYAVKELIDNSLDAKATKVNIDLVDSGLTKIVVTDNGIGMTKEDLVESYKLHTTSKIQKEEQLLSIRSLGFRGEALSSIASVSSLIIESKTSEEPIGTKIELRHGNLTSVSAQGLPDGTRVIVSSIFDNVPVRKKFLKSKRTELKHILEIINKYCIAYPEISWSVAHNGKPLYIFPEHESLRERIQGVFGTHVTNGLLPIELNDSYVTISGFITTPQLSAEGISRQFIRINGRPIDDRLLTLAVKEAYGVLLPKETSPSFFLILTVPFETVDVNIHPRKETIEFMNERLLFDAMYRAVNETLNKYNLSYQMQFGALEELKETKLTTTPLSSELKKQVNPWNTSFLSSIPLEERILQIHNLYLVSEENENLVLIDQHAAHERILYEKFLQELLSEKMKNASIPLKKPLLLSISAVEIPVFEELIPELTRLGFGIEPFSGTTYRILKVPSSLENRNITAFILEMISTKNNREFTQEIDSQSKKLLAYLACKSAVKSGDPLTLSQQKEIIKELRNIPHAATCPHGRPLKIEISFTELAKLFKR